MDFLKSWLTGLLLATTLGTSWASGPAWLQKIGGDTQPVVDDKPKVSLRLTSEFNGLTPQAENALAIIIDHKDGWHTYWKMPGDAGLPTAFSFTKPQDIRITAPAFPIPERLSTTGLMSYGYSDSAIFPFEVKVPRFPKGPAATIGVHVEYLACKDVCVPGEADLQLKLPYSVAPTLSKDAELVHEAVRFLPEHQELQNLTAIYDDERIEITVPSSSVKVQKSLDFFPLDADVLKHTELPLFRHQEDGSAQLVLSLSPRFLESPKENLRGVLIGDGGPRKGGWAIETSIPAQKGSVSSAGLQGPILEDLPIPESTVSVGTMTAILFAFLGGLILNLMPCVFPILSLKLLELLKGHQSGKPLLPHGTAFTAGVLVTMTVLASTLLLLRAFGMSLGWGFQLQSAWVVTTLLLLFIAIALNLFGVFEFTAGSHLADSRILRHAPSSGVMSSFSTGVLAVIVASPCTAPFMGAALGYAVTQPAVIALLVFIALGLGMSLPWLSLCIWPAWSAYLPKPGAWMDTFRKIMAVPMVATVLWLGWVLSKQVTLHGMLLMGTAAGAVTIFLWLLGRAQWGRGKNRSLMGVMAILAISCLAFIGSGNFDRHGSVAGEGHWEAWSDEAVKASLAEGKPVFVDFTAAWCVTCQANKMTALNRDDVQARFKELNYTLLYGDWTNRDPKITELLASFGRSGVPLYLIYRTDGSVEVLPELLTQHIVLEAIEIKK